MMFRNFPPAVLLCAATLLGTAAQAAPGASDAAQQRYALDRQACLSGQSQESRDVCLREAGAALQAARANQLTSEDANTYERNAVQRCSVFKTSEDRSECMGRMTGKGAVSGSVEGGGLLREIVTPVR